MRTKGTTRLAAWRLARGVTQRDLARATGMVVGSLRRLERGEIDDPPLRWLVQCAWALGVDFTDLLEDAWLAWRAHDDEHPQPPQPLKLWRRAPGLAPDLPHAPQGEPAPSDHL